MLKPFYMTKFELEPYILKGSGTDPPKNCHLNILKIARKLPFFFLENCQKWQFFPKFPK